MGNEVNGAVLLGSVDEEALNEDLGISNRLHRKTILAQIDKLKTQEIADLRIQEEERKEQLRKRRKVHKMQIRALLAFLIVICVLLFSFSALPSREMERMDMKEQKHESKLVKDPRLICKTVKAYNGDKYTGN